MRLFPRKKVGHSRRRLLGERSGRQAFSYYQNRVIPDENHISRPNPDSPSKTKLHYLPTIVAIAAIAASLAYMLSVQPRARVLVVNDQDQTTRSFLRPETVYSQAADKWLTGSLLDSNKLTIDTQKFADDLKKQFPELTHVSVSLPIVGRRPLVYVQVTQPSYTYLSSGGVGYILDETGRAMMAAGDSLAPTLVTVKDDTPQPDITLGSQIMPGDQIDFMQTVQKQLAAKGITISSFELPARANELVIKPKGAMFVGKFSFAGDATQESGAYLAVYQQLVKQHKTPNQYIDVRVDERAYYK